MKKFLKSAALLSFFVFLLAEILIAKPAFGTCDCSLGAFSSTPPWTTPDSCFSDSDCVTPCELAYSGTGTPVGLTYVCATTAGGGLPSSGTPPTTTGESESANKIINLENPLGENVTVPQLIGNVIKTLLAVVGALALAMFVYGGFTWLTSGGSPDKIKKGKDILIWAVIGLVVIFTSYSLVDFLLTAFGVAS